MPKMISNRQLSGDYGNVPPDTEFEVSDEKAEALERKGLARSAAPPVITYETKVIVPAAPGVSAREPFRDVPVPDAKPAPVVAESNPVLPSADVPEPRAANRGVRRGRPKSGPKR